MRTQYVLASQVSRMPTHVPGESQPAMLAIARSVVLCCLALPGCMTYSTGSPFSSQLTGQPGHGVRRNFAMHLQYHPVSAFSCKRMRSSTGSE